METDGSQIDVRVTGGHPRSLDTGTTYRFPISEDDDTGIVYSSLPSDCDCGGPFITEEDGDAVDQSVLGFSVDLELAAAVVLGAFVLVALTWATIRRVRSA